MHIGERIKELMEGGGVSVKAMALHCGVTSGAVSNWFRTGRVSKENLLKVAELLGTTADAIIGGLPPLRDRPEDQGTSYALAKVARLISSLPRLERKQVAALLPMLADEPETAQQTCEAILKWLAPAEKMQPLAGAGVSELGLNLAKQLDAIPDETVKRRAHAAATAAISHQEARAQVGHATGAQAPPPSPPPGLRPRKQR